MAISIIAIWPCGLVSVEHFVSLLVHWHVCMWACLDNLICLRLTSGTHVNERESVDVASCGMRTNVKG